MKLDQATVDAIAPAIYETWQYIGSDAMEFVESNREALEMVIDADRMSTCAKAPEADKMVGDLIKSFGYPKVMTFLNKNFRLV